MVWNAKKLWQWPLRMRCDERWLFICSNERYNLYRQVSSELIIYCMRHLKWIILGSLLWQLTRSQPYQGASISTDGGNKSRFHNPVNTFLQSSVIRTDTELLSLFRRELINTCNENKVQAEQISICWACTLRLLQTQTKYVGVSRIWGSGLCNQRNDLLHTCTVLNITSSTRSNFSYSLQLQDQVVLGQSLSLKERWWSK